MKYIKQYCNKLLHSIYQNISCEGMIETILVIAIGIIMLLGIGLKSIKFFITKTRIMQAREVFLFKCRHFTITTNSSQHSSITHNPYNRSTQKQQSFLQQSRNISSTSMIDTPQEAPYVYRDNNHNEVIHPDQIAIIKLDNKKCIRGSVCIHVLWNERVIKYYYDNKLIYSEDTNVFLHEMMKIPLNENKKFHDINNIIML